MKSDALFLAIGEFGKFQILTVTFITILGVIGHSDFIGYTLFYYVPDHKCIIPDNYLSNKTKNLIAINNSTIDEAFQYEGENDDDLLETYCYHYTMPYFRQSSTPEPAKAKRSEWTFDDGYPFGETFVSSFDMLCQYKFRRALGQSLTAIGFLIGATIFGSVSDKYGRVCTIALSAVLKCLCNWLLVLAGETGRLWLFYISYCACCGCSHGLYLVFFVYIIEITGPRMRLFAPALRNMFEVVEDIYCLSFVVMGWEKYQILMCVCGLLILLVLKCYESPLWLISKGLETQAELILLKIADINKRNIPIEHLRNFVAQAVREERPNEEQRNGSVHGRDLSTKWTRWLNFHYTSMLIDFDHNWLCTSTFLMAICN